MNQNNLNNNQSDSQTDIQNRDISKIHIGKIDADKFTSLISKKLGAKNNSIVVPPKNGIDAGVIDIGNGKVLVVAEDPILAIPGQPLEMFGWYTVHIGASDVAVMGVKPEFMTYTLLLPPETPDSHLETIIYSIHKAALELGIAIIGGHTGFYPGFSAPTIGGITVFGITEKDKYITPAMARPGNEVILTKGPAIEATGILSVFREKELSEKMDVTILGKAKELCKKITVVEDALTAFSSGKVTAMHDATEGGVIGGLFEMANASNVGMFIDESLFFYPEEVRLVCRNLNIDPIEAISEGSLLIATEKESSASIIKNLEKKGISATVIGYVTNNPDERVIKRENGNLQRLKVPDEDPFWKVFFTN
ncbi:MAG: hydrogenase expression/formation protein HypE [Euryarchaeota archaeon]|nr:hydrogenase expression/formation protein HypE [Euryarchaeota archaeon]